jgi:preprotein translocase subunit SecG
MQVLNIFHVLIAIALIAFVLIQRGQGATAGAAFGSGASGTVFGARGAGNFLSRSTWVLAALFCTISLVMAVLVSRIMTESPAADLGVVAAVQPQAQTDQQPAEQVPSFGTDESVPLDMPALQPANELQPAIDGRPEGAGERVSGEDLPPGAGVEDPAEPAPEDS